MGAFRKVLVVVGLSLLCCVIAFVPVFWMSDDTASSYSTVLLIAPFVGSFLGGWWVSRGSTTGGKVRWILGGGIGLGLVAAILELILIGIALNAVTSDVSYCC